MSTLPELKAIGNNSFVAGDFSKAAKHYTNAIDQFGPDLVLLSNRAQCWINLGEWQKALNDAEFGLRQNSTVKIEIKLLFRKGMALQAIGNSGLAISCFERVLALDPNNKEAQNALEQSSLPKLKKVRLENEVRIPLEVVDTLPLEYRSIVEGSFQSNYSNTHGELLEAQRAAEELFGGPTGISLESIHPEDHRPTDEKLQSHLKQGILDLNRLCDEDRLQLINSLASLSENDFITLLTVTGLSTEMFEAFLKHLIREPPSTTTKLLLSKLKLLPDIPRFELTLLMCDSLLLRRLKAYLSTHNLLDTLSSRLYEQLFP